MKKEKYLGVDVCCVDMQSVMDEVDGIIERKRPSFIVAINPEKLIKADKDQKLKTLLNSAAIQIPDGVGVVLASKLRHGNVRSRVTGIDLMQNICKRSAEKGYRVFLLGAKPGIAEKAGEILKERYKGLNVVGIQDGYFKEDSQAVDKIKAAHPDIVFAAMGSPKQEYWIKKNMDEIGSSLYMGVGGSYDVICGNIKRAPKWMCNSGLEWLYRLIKEPWRYKRMLVLPVFLLKAAFRKE